MAYCTGDTEIYVRFTSLLPSRTGEGEGPNFRIYTVKGNTDNNGEWMTCDSVTVKPHLTWVSFYGSTSIN